MPANVPTKDEFDTLAARVTALEKTPPVGGPTPDGIYISTPGSAPLVDDVGNAYALILATAPAIGFQITKNGVRDTVTNAVMMIGMSGRKCVQKNASNAWYQDNNNTTKTNTCSWQQISDPTQPAPAPSSIFKVQNGKLYKPDGTVFKAKGVNVLTARVWGDKGWEYDRVTRARLQQSLPGINFVRWACWDGFMPSASDQNWINWINDLTSHGIIVEVDLHYTGDAVAANDGRSNAFLASYANRWKDNPLVHFGTQNEPHGSGGAISAMMLGQHNAIRSTGNQNPIYLCTGNPGGEITGMNQNDIGQMSNVCFDTHCYGWMIGQWQSVLASLRVFHSKDGQLPIPTLETGDGDNSDAINGNWQQVFDTAKNNPDGAAWWMINWNNAQPADLIWAPPWDGSGVTQPYGQMVADAIRTG
jgi:hypothetical protein